MGMQPSFWWFLFAVWLLALLLTLSRPWLCSYTLNTVKDTCDIAQTCSYTIGISGIASCVISYCGWRLFVGSSVGGPFCSWRSCGPPPALVVMLMLVLAGAGW